MIIGDINIDILSERKLHTTERYEEILYSHGFSAQINKHTREEFRADKLSRSCLDHIYYKGLNKDVISSVWQTKITDHYPITLVMKENILKHQEENNSIVLLNRNKYKSTFQELIDSSSLDDITDGNDIYIEIKELIMKSKNIASTEMTLKSRAKPINPWMTNNILHDMKRRDKLHKKLRKAICTREQQELLRNQYKSLRNKINNEIREAKRKYFEKDIEGVKHNMKQVWKKVNEALGKRSKTNDVERLFDSFDAETDEQKQILIDNMSTYYNKIVHERVHTCNNILLTGNVANRQCQTIYIPPATEEEINNIILEQKNSKATGWDKIKPIDLKDVLANISSPITRMVNYTLKYGKIPTQLKQSIVRPLYKEGKRNDFKNYRPISLLPIVSKVMERYVERKITNYLRKYEILDKQQYGYQKGKGTINLLESLTEDINNSLDGQFHMLIISVDFSKAFDLINHTKLLLLIQEIGIRGSILQWMRDYLNQRTYRIQIGNFESKCQYIKRGVPQGSILGPLLYLLYVNDIKTCFSRCKYYMYADDTVITVRHKNLQVAAKMLQEEFNLFQKWAHDKEIIINPVKTKIMHIRESKMKSNEEIAVVFHKNDCLHLQITQCNCNDKIELVKKQKYLGVIIDEHMTWEAQISKLRTQLRCLSYSFFYIRNFMSQKTLIMIYNALVESLINYGITCYGQASKYLIERLQHTQNSIIKHVRYADKNSEGVHLQNINQLFATRIILHNINDIKNWKTINHQHETRLNTKGTFKIEIFKNKFGKRKKEILVRNIFNKIPANILNKQNKTNFRKELKTWINESIL